MNRRMRTRMSGGVRGGAGDRSLYSIVFAQSGAPAPRYTTLELTLQCEHEKSLRRLA
jgi:hypothetical protein